jgi:hypothetical protein
VRLDGITSPPGTDRFGPVVVPEAGPWQTILMIEREMALRALIDERLWRTPFEIL